MRFSLAFVLLLYFAHCIRSQDTMLLKVDMLQNHTTFPVIADKNYDKYEAKNLIFKKNVESYTDWGRLFRSYRDYWTGGILVNESIYSTPILLEGDFKELWIDGNPVAFCRYELCKDPEGIIKQPQLHAAFAEIESGSHVFVAKLGDFHLRKNFSVAVSNRNYFEGNIMRVKSKLHYSLIFLSGIFFVLIILSLLIYLFIKDLAFLFYSIFCASLWIYVNRTLGENFEQYYVIDKWLPWLYFKYVWFLILYSSYFLFSKNYLKSHGEFTKIGALVDIVLKLLYLSIIPEMVLLLLGYNEISYSYYFIMRNCANIFGVYILFLLYKERKSVFVKFILIGGSLLLFSEIFTSLFQNKANNAIGFIGFLSEIIVFAAALAYKVYYKFFHVILLENENANKELTIEKLEKEKLKLSMNSLQAQLNPHFIFNSMNSIKEFIITNQTTIASEYLTKFSVLMRKVLDYSAKDSIHLDDEILITKQYIEFLQLMSYVSISYQFHIDEKLERELIMVPPMIIQPYIENIYEHAFTKQTTNNNFEVSFFDEETKLVIEISDNGIGMKNGKTDPRLHDSKGMEITKDRIITWGRFYNKSSEVIIYDLSKNNQQNGTKIRIEL